MDEQRNVDREALGKSLKMGMSGESEKTSQSYGSKVKTEKEMGVKTEDELQRCAVVQSDLSLGRRPS